MPNEAARAAAAGGHASPRISPQRAALALETWLDLGLSRSLRSVFPMSTGSRFTYTVGGTPAARANSLTSAGAVNMQAEHWLALVLPLSAIGAAAAGGTPIAMHLLDVLLLDLMVWSGELRSKHLAHHDGLR